MLQFHSIVACHELFDVSGSGESAQPLCWPQQALRDCFKGGSVEIQILGLSKSLWLYLESITENLPKLPLAAT